LREDSCPSEDGPGSRPDSSGPNRWGGTPFKDATNALRSTNASLVLAAADHFYWLNNGPAAAPLYARAEELFSQNGDKRNELHAKIGRLRCEAGFIVLAGVCNGT